MSRKSSRRQTLSEHTNVQSVPSNTFLPPGAPDPNTANTGAPEANTEGQATEVVEGQEVAEPAVVVLDGDTQEQTESKGKKANFAKGPRKLSERERLQLSSLLTLLPLESAIDTLIPMEQLPEDVKESLYATGTARNLFQRMLATPVYGEDKSLIGLKLTEVALSLYDKVPSAGKTKQSRATKADGTPKSAGGRTSNRYDGLRLKILRDTNPRRARSHGFYSFELYRDGMSFKEYMSIKDYPQSITEVNTVFSGPQKYHWESDLFHGYIGLYHEGENETLEDGSPNPKYWYNPATDGK